MNSMKNWQRSTFLLTKKRAERPFFLRETSVNRKIIAITVSYNPNIPSLKRQIKVLLASQVAVVVVDNNSTNSEQLTIALAEFSGQLTLMCLAENEGIAAAQNRGIRMAKSKGSTMCC